MAPRAMDRATLASMIDQTLLKPTVGFAAASEWMTANRDAGFATLCVSPFLVPLAVQRLAGTCTRVCAVGSSSSAPRRSTWS
jgi:deoxyribose-phosphate aldolase